jgi:hypothetical protein
MALQRAMFVSAVLLDDSFADADLTNILLNHPTGTLMHHICSPEVRRIAKVFGRTPTTGYKT